MSIHHEHPFLPGEQDRDPVRRFRGRLAAPVTVWTTGTEDSREGWTISSMLVCEGGADRPSEVLALLDEDSELADALQETGTACVNVLDWPRRGLADAFARVAPAPGGPFRGADWEQTAWGPRLVGASWAGVRITEASEHAGWALLVRAQVESVHLEDDESLIHLRGRYLAPPVSSKP